MVLNVYYDLLSQPCRVLLMFLDKAKIPYEKKVVSLFTGDHKKPAYTAINPNQSVPCIEDTDKKFILTESVAIMKYLCDAYKVDEHWYPREDLIKRSRVDEYLAWQHIGARQKCAMVFLNATIRKGQFENRGDIEGDMHKALSVMEDYFLKDRDFLAGNEISIADLFGACEIMQPLVGAKMDILKTHSKLRKWLERVKNYMNPHFDQSHKNISQLQESLKKQKK